MWMQPDTPHTTHLMMMMMIMMMMVMMMVMPAMVMVMMRMMAMVAPPPASFLLNCVHHIEGANDDVQRQLAARLDVDLADLLECKSRFVKQGHLGLCWVLEQHTVVAHEPCLAPRIDSAVVCKVELAGERPHRHDKGRVGNVVVERGCRAAKGQRQAGHIFIIDVDRLWSLNISTIGCNELRDIKHSRVSLSL
jgi:hypothetical protein